MSNRPVRIQKRLLQFNQLPFAFGEITDPSYSIAFKGESQPYTNNAHGSYFPTLGESGILQASSFRASFDIDFRKITCEDKVRYARFIKRELAKSGKLWAVQNATELMWTNARVIDISEQVDDPGTRDMFRFTVTFELLDGFWRLAKRTRTFLCEYCPNRFEDFDESYCNDLYDYYGVCDNTGKSSCLPCDLNDYTDPVYEGCHWKPLCYFPLFNSRTTSRSEGKNPDGTDRRVIETIPSLYDMFGVACSNQWYIRYDCELENEWFCYDGSWGRKWRLEAGGDQNTTTRTFCSRTDLPTNMVRVRLVGDFVDPTVTINGDTVKLPSTDGSSYNGIITIGFGTEVWWSTNYRDPWNVQPDGQKRVADMSFKAERTNTPMFELKAGKNTITVSGNQYQKDAFVYIDSVDITW